jgi:NACalpha-BTF3-like transcription factor
MGVNAIDSTTPTGHVDNQHEDVNSDTDTARDPLADGINAREADAKLLQDVKDLLKELGLKLPGEEEGAKAEGSAPPETGGATPPSTPAKAEQQGGKATEDKQPSREDLIELIAKALNVSKAEAEKALDSLSDDSKDGAAPNPRVGMLG